MKSLYVKASTISLAVSALFCSNAMAAVTLYEDDTKSVSSDLLVNVFYVNSSIDTPNGNRDQSRVKVGFLPNYVGFNYKQEIAGLKLGGRASFWVTLNDTDVNRGAEGLGTRSGIDVRQFYATVDGNWGQLLLGKDFGLFGRSNILNDELLLGYGNSSDSFGLVDGGNVSFGNIGSGYTYPFPKAQITYRSPEASGFQAAIGIMDPNKADAASSEERPRLEAEFTYKMKFSGEKGNFNAFISGVTQESEVGTTTIDSTGVSGGIRVGFAGLSINASAYKTEGLGTVAGLDTIVATEDNESKGYLLQGAYKFSDERLVVSYGHTKNDGAVNLGKEYDNLGFAWFHSFNANFTSVLEYNKTEVNNGDLEENNTISLGAVITF